MNQDTPREELVSRIEEIQKELSEFNQMNLDKITDKTMILVGGRIALLASEAFKVADMIGVDIRNAVDGIDRSEVEDLETAYHQDDAEAVREILS